MATALVPAPALFTVTAAAPTQILFLALGSLYQRTYENPVSLYQRTCKNPGSFYQRTYENYGSFYQKTYENLFFYF
jgi:hypothetical protein